MKELLAVFITCFFLLMCILIVILIIKGIFYIIYQKSDKIHFSLFLYCNIEPLYFTLMYKNKKIDDIFVYGKYKRRRYFVGTDGIYTLKKHRINKIQEYELQDEERSFIYDMIKDRLDKVENTKKVIDSFLNKYNGLHILENKLD